MRKFALLSYALCLYCGIASAETISIQPPTQSVPLGGVLAVDVNVSGLPDLFAFQFDIRFNPAVLSATTVTEGALFSGIGVSFSPGIIDNTAGIISFIGDALSGPGPGISGNGTLATVSFNSIGAGFSGIALSNIVLLNSALSDIIVISPGASVEVVGPEVVPDPATPLLVLPVLAMIGRHSRNSSKRQSGRT